MAFLEVTTEEKIAAFEQKQTVTLPSKYKEWLLFSDGGEFFLPAVSNYMELNTSH